MVFFTCNHCGESIKKQAVEKHYNNSKCRGGPIFVSCIDCLKDFHGEEYVKHTSCVSELEKYSGKGYVAKESLNKGKKKQDSWLEIVRSILNTTEYNLKASVKIIFQRLQSHDNVPRNKRKFENFVTNSMRINKKEASDVWCILEKELEKMKQASAAKRIENENGTKTNGITENGQDDVTENGKEQNQKKTKTKTKKSTHEELNDKVGEDPISVENPKKSKKKKKSKNDLNEDENSEPLKNGVEINEDLLVNEEPKKKKKSKKRPIEETTETLIENEKVVIEPNEEEPIKKKSKKNPIKDETETDEIKQELELSLIENGNFNWVNVIANCVKDGMSLEKLKKKVLKKHKELIGQNENTNINKLEKTFKKYLKKTNYFVENNTIKV